MKSRCLSVAQLLVVTAWLALGPWTPFGLTIADVADSGSSRKRKTPIVKAHDKARAAELRRAERFITKHGIGNLPKRRSETGESADYERSDWLGGADRIQAGVTGRRNLVSYSQFDTLDAWENWMLDTDQGYSPLVGGATPSGLEQVEKRARMAHVLSFMLPAHQELLFERHVRGRTLDDIAAEHFVTRQAIIKRLKVAEQDFRKFFGEHWNDPVDVNALLYEQEQRSTGGSP